MPMIEQFLNAFPTGGARSNHFRVTGSFPGGASGILGKLGQAASVGAGAGSLLGGSAGSAVAGAANALGGAAAGAGVIAGALGISGLGSTTDIQFAAKAASLPESTLGEVSVKFQGRTVKFPGERTYPNWTITVLNDAGFVIRDKFIGWHQLINDPAQNVGSVGTQLMMDFFVEQLASDDTTLKKIKIYKCFPNLVGPITLNWDNDNQIETYDVSFSYQYWV